MATTMTTTLGTSNIRSGSYRQTRSNPTRTSKTTSNLRQNSLISNPSAAFLGTNPPHGFFPAITSFSDAVTALPRDYRRHVSLLKEVDAKAFALEENLQHLLAQCLIDQTTPSTSVIAQQGIGSTAHPGEDQNILSASNSVNGVMLDAASQYSAQSIDPTTMQRRQNYAALRQTLMQIMVTMDEKNHVINNANEELSRHIRRLDNVWPHIADEISEEARLGSLKHWAYTETNPTKKNAAPSSRREAAASLAIMHDSEISHRSESRREAMLAKKQRLNQQVDSDFEEARPAPRKTMVNGKRRITELIADTVGQSSSSGTGGKRKKPDKALGGVGMERSLSSAIGGRAMSREPSQQENKKRKAPAVASTVARKRINANAQDSPKLASSPLASSFGKEAYKKSPALSSVRPVVSRARQNSAQVLDNARARPSSSASHRNTNGGAVTASTPELNTVAAITEKSANEVKNTMKETITSKGDRLLEEASTDNMNGDISVRGAILLERSASKHGGSKVETAEDNISKKVASPRLPSILTSAEARNDRSGRARASKTSTPVVGSFADAESGDSGPNNGHGNGNGNGNSKSKRPARPRIKDHGLHDSLSPKGLPMKRSHKKGASSISQQITSQRLKDEIELNNPRTRDGGKEEEEDDDEYNMVAEDDQHYCYCNGVSYGQMVACDNLQCAREWFHLDCIGLKSVPKSAKWYCDECKENVKKGNGNGK